MKQVLLSLAFLFIAALGYASHIVGGVIHYECLGNGDYAITLKVYRDCSPGSSGFDNTAHVGVYEGSTLIATVDMPLSQATVTPLDPNTGDPCLEPPDVCVEESVYTGEVNLPDTEIGYTLVYQRCCRNTTIVNIPAQGDNLGSSFTCEIPPASQAPCNSNPDFIQFPPIVICINEPFVFDHSATDIDGDSLVYVFCNPLDGGNPGAEMNPPTAPPYTLVTWNDGYSLDYPIDAAPAFSIDPITGLLTGTPNQLGQYVMGICVKEYRNGELISTTNRDFQFNIAACSQSIFAAVDDVEPCTGLSYVFDNQSNGEIFEWDFGVEQLSSDTSSLFEPEYTFPDTGTYEVTLIVNPGFQCADTTQITVSAYTPISTSLDIENFYCSNGSRYWDFTGVGSYSSQAEYSWSFGNFANPQTSTVFNPGPVGYNVPGTYNVTFSVLDHFCEATANLMLVVDPMPQAEIQGQTQFCGGLEIDFTNLSQYAEEYYWNFGESGNSDWSADENPSWTYSSYGEFVVTLTADPQSDCADMDTILVQVLPTDPIQLVYDVIEPNPCDSIIEVQLQFLGTGVDNIAWNMGDGTILTGFESTYIYDEAGEYIVTITAQNNLCGLIETESVGIVYDLTVIDRPIEVPNVFTPNSDGSNDTFRIFYVGEWALPDLYPPGRDIFDYVSDYDLKIYDRWGVLIYQSTEDFPNWNGRIDNSPVPDGTYYYITQYKRKCIDTNITRKAGHFSVIR
ncbi:MAG: gliding motility-associated C-terminal domain-containing protein [Flavobacteriales bacterium]|nr:gliding motility-associated C-terminal domain-containing protein [Flavobacteriales bacterium]